MRMPHGPDRALVPACARALEHLPQPPRAQIMDGDRVVKGAGDNKPVVDLQRRDRGVVRLERGPQFARLEIPDTDKPIGVPGHNEPVDSIDVHRPDSALVPGQRPRHAQSLGVEDLERAVGRAGDKHITP
eukprot:Amastigsp_a845055_8.p3 type:complete len:130 gc:universal Amastigsp_a845055_8:459-848(+)